MLQYKQIKLTKPTVSFCKKNQAFSQYMYLKNTCILCTCLICASMFLYMIMLLFIFFCEKIIHSYKNQNMLGNKNLNCQSAIWSLRFMTHVSFFCLYILNNMFYLVYCLIILKWNPLTRNNGYLICVAGSQCLNCHT